ncbi:MAG: T9SS type A sorting domain-containing protein [Saprospiraceae bacterium]|nr:T9SS type A sorting domain-containing protein [Saprospiraceae bacterium]
MKFFTSLICFLCYCFTWSQIPCGCDPLSDPTGTIVQVSTVAELNAALSHADANNGNMTIVLAAGEYQLTTNLLFIGDNIVNLSIRGATGNRDDVVIRGLGHNNSAVTHIFNVPATGFTVADMTIGEVFYHPIQLHNSADDALVHNVRFIDAKEQLLKVSSGDGFNDDGVVQCCLFEFTQGIAYQYYTGGIDAHKSRNWRVTNNEFKHIRSPDESLAEHAIHFWGESLGTVVEGNVIINCDRGVGFGLGPNATSGHTGGIVMNNFIHTSRDVGIGLESAPEAKVYNNTVVTENYFNSIEYRFSNTTEVHVANNLVDKLIASRNGGTGNVENNVTISNLDIFTDASNHDYHLHGNTSGITDSGISLVEVSQDVDCQSRVSPIDVGADEYAPLTNTDVVLASDGISLYPNPTEETFTIVASPEDLLDDFDIEVLDGSGQIYQSYTQMSGIVEISLSSLPAGLYYVRIRRDNILSIQLILKGI